MEKPTLTSFTKLAPLLIQKYERYLPTAFDESLSLVEKVNLVVEYMNQIGIISNDIIEQWNEVMEWVMSDGLNESIIDKLDEMISDGTFDVIINQTIFGDFNKRLNDYAVNVDTFDSVHDAVQYAYENNVSLDWGNRSYTVSTTIPNLHNVNHKGTGQIVRGSEVFFINPYGLQENKIYVSNSNGVDSNDGLSSSTALRTIQKAFDILSIKGEPLLTGKWTVIVDGGIYPRARMRDGLRSENEITIKGPDVGGHPNIPTAVVSEGTGISAMGLRFDGKVNVFVKDIKVRGFNGSTSSAGINVASGGDLRTENVHTDTNYFGISGQTSNLEVPDGIHENNGYLSSGGGNGACIRSLQINRHHVGKQNNGNRINTAVFKNSKTGVFIQENSTGHVDWCTFDNCEDGVQANVNARANADGSSFSNCIRGIRETGNSHIYVSNNCVFSNNQANIVSTSGSQLTTTKYFDTLDTSYSTQDNILDIEYVNKDIQNTVNESYFTLTLKAPFFKNIVNSVTPVKKLEFVVYGNITNNTGVEGSGTKNLALRLGSQSVSISLGITEQGTFKITGNVYFVDESTQLLFIEGNTHLNAVKHSRKIVNVDMTQDSTLRLEAQTNQILDKIHVDLVEFKFAG